MQFESLATEILKELRAESKRRFIMLILTIALLFASNIAWLIAWNLPSRSVSESYDMMGDNGSDVIYNEVGDGSKQAMVQKLERLMDEPVSENDRLAIMDCINKIK